jgi:hypothetical protein
MWTRLPGLRDPRQGLAGAVTFKLRHYLLFDQLRDPQSAAPLAPAACNLQHRDLAGDLAERDGAASHWLE